MILSLDSLKFFYPIEVFIYDFVPADKPSTASGPPPFTQGRLAIRQAVCSLYTREAGCEASGLVSLHKGLLQPTLYYGIYVSANSFKIVIDFTIRYSDNLQIVFL